MFVDGSAFMPIANSVICTTIIPTIARRKLIRAVESALEQPLSADEHEIIVVNDTGQSLAPAPWQLARKVQIVPTNRRERCIARNTGAALATGRYLHFLDDDDWLLPEGLSHLRDLSLRHPSADWLVGGSQLFDRQGEPLIRLDHQLQGNCFVHAMAGEWLPLQSSFIRTKAFNVVGGFRPKTLVSQDVDLCRRILLRGELASIGENVACIEMGIEGSTTDYERRDEYSREAREAILNDDGVLKRLFESVTSAEWSGRVTRIYLGSAVWNAQRNRGWTALSRLVYTFASMGIAGVYLLSPDFWYALMNTYESATFARGLQTVNDNLVASH
ncbi:MAG: glycosyltransferase family 2 protein [Chloroflexota bacterium]|nr:MAG: glycosyltransferase family 2 protein [Chloroflexota bacterium]